MNGRKIGALLIVALVVVGLGIWLSSRKVDTTERVTGRLVLPGLKTRLNDLSEVRLAKGDGSRVTLRRQPDGWRVVERDYPADTTKVRKLLIDLSSLEAVEAKTSDPAKYSLLGVENVDTPTATGTSIEVGTAKVAQHGIIIGKSSGMKSGYVRAMDSKQSLLATPMIRAETDPKQWLDTTLLDIPEARVKEIEVAPAAGPSYKVSREKKEQMDFTVAPLPKGRELSSPSVGNGYGSALVLLSLTDVRKAAEGDAAKTPSVIFRTFDGLELHLTGQSEGDHRLISIAAQSTAKESADEAQKLEARVKSWRFEIPNYKYDALFRPLEEMLKALPEKKKPEKKTEKKK